MNKSFKSFKQLKESMELRKKEIAQKVQQPPPPKDKPVKAVPQPQETFKERFARLTKPKSVPESFQSPRVKIKIRKNGKSGVFNSLKKKFS